MGGGRFWFGHRNDESCYEGHRGRMDRCGSYRFHKDRHVMCGETEGKVRCNHRGENQIVMIFSTIDREGERLNSMHNLALLIMQRLVQYPFTLNCEARSFLVIVAVSAWF